MKALLKILPWLFVALFATEIVVAMLPKANQGLHVREFGRLPVLLNGQATKKLSIQAGAAAIFLQSA